MRITERWNRGVPIIAVHEKFVSEDGKAIGDAVGKLIASGERNILLDLKDVVKVDSAGIGEIVRSFVKTADAGGHLKLLHPSDQVVKLLSTGRLLTIFGQLYDNEDEAVQSFAEHVCPPPPAA